MARPARQAKRRAVTAEEILAHIVPIKYGPVTTDKRLWAKYRNLKRENPSKRRSSLPANKQPLSATANAFSGEVWSLFQRICDACGLEEAILLFDQATEAGRTHALARHLAGRLGVNEPLPQLRYPAMAEINAADQKQICLWYEQLREPKNNRERATFARITKRYLEFGGATETIKKEISKLTPPPPRKRRGSRHISEQERADLLALFDESNPNSQWSLADQGRLVVKEGEPPRRLTKLEFAELLVTKRDEEGLSMPGYGSSARHILRKLKYLRTRN